MVAVHYLILWRERICQCYKWFVRNMLYLLHLHEWRFSLTIDFGFRKVSRWKCSVTVRMAWLNFELHLSLFFFWWLLVKPGENRCFFSGDTSQVLSQMTPVGNEDNLGRVAELPLKENSPQSRTTRWLDATIFNRVNNLLLGYRVCCGHLL